MAENEEIKEPEEEQPNLTEALAEEMSEEEEPQPEPEAEAPAEEPAEEPEEEQAATVKVGDREMPVTDLENYARLADWAGEHPEVYERLLEWEQKGLEPESTQPAPTPQTAEEPEYVDPEDRIARLEGQLSALTQERQQVERAEFMASIEDGIDRFRNDHPEVSDAEMPEILTELRDLQILPSFRDKYRARPVTATSKALEVAFRNRFFDRVVKEKAPNVKEMRTRRAAASASPVPASAPRTEPLPENPAERKEAMAAELREAMEQ